MSEVQLGGLEVREQVLRPGGSGAELAKGWPDVPNPMRKLPTVGNLRQGSFIRWMALLSFEDSVQYPLTLHGACGLPGSPVHGASNHGTDNR